MWLQCGRETQCKGSIDHWFSGLHNIVGFLLFWPPVVHAVNTDTLVIQFTVRLLLAWQKNCVCWTNHSSFIIVFSPICVIKDKGKAFLTVKPLNYTSQIENPTHTETYSLSLTHTKPFSNLSPWSWVGSCVQQRLMKASHLKDRLENEAWMLSKGPKWPLDAEAPALSASTQAPFNLPLLFANTWLYSEWERGTLYFCVLLFLLQ